MLYMPEIYRHWCLSISMIRAGTIQHVNMTIFITFILWEKNNLKKKNNKQHTTTTCKAISVFLQANTSLKTDALRHWTELDLLFL